MPLKPVTKECQRRDINKSMVNQASQLRTELNRLLFQMSFLPISVCEGEVGIINCSSALSTVTSATHAEVTVDNADERPSSSSHNGEATATLKCKKASAKLNDIGLAFQCHPRSNDIR